MSRCRIDSMTTIYAVVVSKRVYRTYFVVIRDPPDGAQLHVELAVCEHHREQLVDVECERLLHYQPAVVGVGALFTTAAFAAGENIFWEAGHV